MSLSKPLNSQTRKESSPTLIFFKGRKERHTKERDRDFSVLVNLDKVSLKLEKSTFGRDTLYFSEEKKVIAKLEFVYSESMFEVDRLFLLVKRNKKTPKCTENRVDFGIIRMAETASTSRLIKNEERQALLKEIKNKGVTKEMFKGDYKKDKIDCLAKNDTFAFTNTKCLKPFYHKSSNLFYERANKKIHELMGIYKSKDNPEGFYHWRYNLLEDTVNSYFFHSKFTCGMNILREQPEDSHADYEDY